MAYQTPKTVLDAVLASLRAWPTAPLAGCVFRKGPQHSVALAGTETGIVIVGLESLAGGEVSAGSGNNWWHEWTLALTAMVLDNEAAPETAEDNRLDLIEELGHWMHDTRTLSGGAKVGHIASCTLWAGTFFADTQQVFRGADLTITYKTLRS